jgi:hypothetical protein
MAETLHLGVGLDTRDFARFAKALRRASPEIRRALVLRLRTAGEIVAEEARAYIEGSSRSIPPTIKVRVSAATVAVVAGGKDNAIAGLLELGNKGNRGAPGATFRHPVFGGPAWVQQSTHPFLAPAVREKIVDVERAAIDALDAAIAMAVAG